MSSAEIHSSENYRGDAMRRRVKLAEIRAEREHEQMIYAVNSNKIWRCLHFVANLALG